MTANTPEAHILLRGKPLAVPAGQTLQDALDSLEIPAELYLAVRRGELLNAADLLQPGDQVRLVGVQAGG